MLQLENKVVEPNTKAPTPTTFIKVFCLSMSAPAIKLSTLLATSVPMNPLICSLISPRIALRQKVSGNPDNNDQQTGNGKYCIISQTRRIFHRRRVIPLRKGISQNFPEKFNVFQHFKTDILLLY